MSIDPILKCLVIVPAYNEEQNIISVIKNELLFEGVDCHMLVVNDNSRDQTENILKQYNKQSIHLSGLIPILNNYRFQYVYDKNLMEEGTIIQRIAFHPLNNSPSFTGSFANLITRPAGKFSFKVISVVPLYVPPFGSIYNVCGPTDKR